MGCRHSKAKHQLSEPYRSPLDSPADELFQHIEQEYKTKVIPQLQQSGQVILQQKGLNFEQSQTSLDGDLTVKDNQEREDEWNEVKETERITAEKTYPGDKEYMKQCLEAAEDSTEAPSSTEVGHESKVEVDRFGSVDDQACIAEEEDEEEEEEEEEEEVVRAVKVNPLTEFLKTVERAQVKDAESEEEEPSSLQHQQLQMTQDPASEEQMLNETGDREEDVLSRPKAATPKRTKPHKAVNSAENVESHVNVRDAKAPLEEDTTTSESLEDCFSDEGKENDRNSFNNVGNLSVSKVLGVQKQSEQNSFSSSPKKSKRVGFNLELNAEIRRSDTSEDQQKTAEFDEWLANSPLSDSEDEDDTESTKLKHKRDQQEVKKMINKRKSMAPIKIGRVQMLASRFETNSITNA